MGPRHEPDGNWLWCQRLETILRDAVPGDWCVTWTRHPEHLPYERHGAPKRAVGWWAWHPGRERWEWLAADPEGARLAAVHMARDITEPGWRSARRRKVREFFAKLLGVFLTVAPTLAEAGADALKDKLTPPPPPKDRDQ